MVDQLQASQLTINPASGSYLSAENRKKMFSFGGKKSPSSLSSNTSIVPIRTGPSPQSLTPTVNPDTLAISSLQEQVSNLNARNTQLTASLGSINALQNQINILRVSVSDLGSTLQQIGSLINTDSQLEIQKDNQEIENERRLSQRSIREGKESELEQKIQTALVTPVRETSTRVQGILESLMGFFGNLFVGWLTNQGIEALRASFNDNKRKLDDIKNSTISNLLAVGGIFTAFRFGIGNVFSTISSLSSTVGRFLLGGVIGKLFDNLFKLIPGAKAPTPTQGKPGGNKPAGGFGTLFGAGMEAFQGNWLEAGLGAASFLPGIPGAVAKGAFWLEQGLDIFGKGFIPEDNKQIKLPQSIQLPDIKDLFKSSDNTPINSTNPQTTSSTSGFKPLSPIVETPKISSPPTLFASNTSEASKPQDKMVSSPTPQSMNSQTLEIKPQVTLSPQPSEFQFSSDKINAFDTFGPSNQENLLDFSKAPLYGRVKINTSEQNQEIEKPQQNQSDFSNLIPIQSQRMQTSSFDIKPEPEPKPTIIYQKTSSQQSAPGSAPLKTGSATNVPSIASSNFDNMYTLYSQASYNVIV